MIGAVVDQSDMSKIYVQTLDMCNMCVGSSVGGPVVLRACLAICSGDPNEWSFQQDHA